MKLRTFLTLLLSAFIPSIKHPSLAEQFTRARQALPLPVLLSRMKVQEWHYLELKAAMASGMSWQVWRGLKFQQRSEQMANYLDSEIRWARLRLSKPRTADAVARSLQASTAAQNI